MNSPSHKQEGSFSILGVCVVFACIGLLGYTAIKLIPLYQGARTVEQALNEISADPNLQEFSHTQIKQKILERLYLDYITCVDTEDIMIYQDGMIKVSYQARANILGELDFILSSEKAIAIN